MAFGAASRLRRPHSRGDGPPVFSHEFIIQNHADIAACICVVIFLALVPQATNGFASKFIFLQYNETVQTDVNATEGVASSRIDNRPVPVTYYRHGWSDALNVVFYSLIWIIVHSIVQEYVWERSVKRLRLSKTKTSKYLDSGTMLIFYGVSFLLGLDHILKGQYVASFGEALWKDYPHTLMELSLKFYILVQMGFWVHCIPELYIMKTKKEDIYSKIVVYTTSLLIICSAYVTYLQRLAIVLLVAHNAVEFLFNGSRLLHYHGKDKAAGMGFKIWWILFLAVRVFTVAISVMTLWFGISTENGPVLLGKIDLTTPIIRLSGLVFIVILQLWLLIAVMTHRNSKKKDDETTPTQASTKSKGANKQSSPRSSKKKQ